MQNLHTLVAGRTGSGKTLLAKALILLTARAVVFDRLHEYNLPRAFVAYSLQEAVNHFLTNRAGFLRLVCRFEEPEDYLQLLELVEHTQRVEPLGPIVVLLEEASQYSETHVIDERIRRVYNAGRHLRISLLTVIQVDTDIHRVTRRNSQVIVSCAQNGLSVDMQRYFNWYEVEAITPLSAQGVAARLPRTSAGEPMPVQDFNYLVYPDHIDLYETWWQAHGFIYQSA